MREQCLKVVALACALLMVSAVGAAPRDDAIGACNKAISNAYDVHKFRGTVAEKTGHKKFTVHGNVRVGGGRHPYSCRVKRGRVATYSYRGPSGSKHNHGGASHHGTAGKLIAAGVGLAIIAAIASNSGSGYDSSVNNHGLEDECHDAIRNRLRGEHHNARRVKFDMSKIKHDGRKVVGSGHIRWRHRGHSSLRFKCHFNARGRVIDTSYSFT